MCNNKLDSIQEKLDKVLALMPKNKDEVEEIHIERVHGIPTHPNREKRVQPRAIISKVSFFQDKEFINTSEINLEA